MEPDMKDKIDYAVKKWELDRLEVIYEHPANGVFSAESRNFGPVILKINQHKSQLESEYRMLSRLSGHYSCNVYAFDESTGLLLEERIFPGTVLRRETSLGKRIRAFLKVFREIHMPADSGTAYLNWLEQICEYCVRNQMSEDMASRAHLFCAEMFEKYPDRQHIEEVIRLLDEQSGYPAADIGKLFYMETVLANSWCLEDGEEMNRQELELADFLVSHEGLR